eukprot:5353772-Karenia_brevis.AAC.1
MAQTQTDSEDVEYIRISKWDRSFVRFCTGKALDLRPGSKFDINNGFLDALSGDFQSACNTAVTQALSVNEDVDPH